jgi:hypothetical protein
MPTVTRRSFILGAGAVAASAGLAWGLSTSELWRGAAADPYPVPACCGYVYHEGWLLTRADRDRLIAQGDVKSPE